MQILMNYVNSWLSKDLNYARTPNHKTCPACLFLQQRLGHLDECLRLFTKSLTLMNKSVIPARQVFQMAAGVGAHAHPERSRLDRKLIIYPQAER